MIRGRGSWAYENGVRTRFSYAADAAAGRLEVALHPSHVAPRVELVAHPPEYPDRRKPQRHVQPFARIVRQGRARHGHPETHRPKPVQEPLVDLTPSTAASLVTVEVDAGFAGPSVGRARAVGTGVGVPDDDPFNFTDEPRMVGLGGLDARGEVGGRGWGLLEGDRGVGDVGRVDRRARRGVSDWIGIPQAKSRANGDGGHTQSLPTGRTRWNHVGMSRAAEVTIAATPAGVWRVLTDLEAWPSWSPSITDVKAEAPSSEDLAGDALGGQSAYRVEQPPLPHGLWTITDWQPELSFTWQTRGASSLLRATFTLTAHGPTTNVTHDLRWSGPMAWMARATYGPVSLRYADQHLTALARRCETVG